MMEGPKIEKLFSTNFSQSELGTQKSQSKQINSGHKN